jgi:hypothetical protein
MCPPFFVLVRRAMCPCLILSRKALSAGLDNCLTHPEVRS